MANTAEKVFRLSDLSAIANIDNEDLLLVSDYEGGKCYTRNMTVERFMGHISANITKEGGDLEKAVEQTTSKTVTESLADPDSDIFKAVAEIADGGDLDD